MEITRSKRTAISGVAIAALTVGAVAAGTAPAHASVPPAKCGTVNPAKATGVHTARTAHAKAHGHRITIQVRYGYLNGHQYGWARISNANGGHLNKHDGVGLDVTDGKHTKYCPMKYAKGGESNVWTKAVRTSKSTKFKIAADGVAYSKGKTDWGFTKWW